MNQRANLPAFTGDHLLRLRDVEAKTGLGSSTIYRKIAEGAFPHQVRLGPNTVRWRASEIDAWIAGLERVGE